MKRTNSRAPRALASLALGALALVSVACSDSSSTSTPSVALPPRVVVTSVKGDARSQLLAAMYARVLEDAGFRVSRKDPVDMDRAAYYQALQDGQFSVIPDFTYDLLQFVYDQPGAPTSPTTSVPSQAATTVAPVTVPATTTAVPATTTGDTTADTAAATTTSEAATTTTTTPAPNSGRSVQEQLLAIKAALPAALSVSNGLGAEDKQVFACTDDGLKASNAVQLVTLTDLASSAPNLRLGASKEFLDDQFSGLPAFELYYGGEFKSTTEVEADGLAAAIDSGAADCFVLNSMNSLIASKKLTVLIDDKVMVPSNAAVALLASSIASADLVAALDKISNALTTSRLNQMVNEVESNGTDPVVVANAFIDTL